MVHYNKHLGSSKSITQSKCSAIDQRNYWCSVSSINNSNLNAGLIFIINPRQVKLVIASDNSYLQSTETHFMNGNCQRRQLAWHKMTRYIDHFYTSYHIYSFMPIVDNNHTNMAGCFNRKGYADATSSKVHMHQHFCIGIPFGWKPYLIGTPWRLRRTYLMRRSSRLTSREELATVILMEMTSWRQNSRALWLEIGDRNTSYFYRVANLHGPRTSEV